MAFLIGDTVRLSATIKNLAGEEEAPASVTVSIYRDDHTTALVTTQAATLKAGTTAEYYYDWTIATVTAAETLTALWIWTGPHKKTIDFEVEPAI